MSGILRGSDVRDHARFGGCGSFGIGNRIEIRFQFSFIGSISQNTEIKMLKLSGIPKDQHTSEVHRFAQYGSCRQAHWLKAYKKAPHNADSKVFSCVA